MKRLPDPFDPLDGPIASTLDLHGVGATAAPAMVASFLATAARRWPGGLVHVITGRGRGSPGRPVLKPLVKRLLAGELARYARAHGADLDEGGYLIRLKG